jgi:Phage integrase family.
MNKSREDKLFSVGQSSVRDIFVQVGQVLGFKIYPHRFRATWATEFSDKVGSFSALKEQGGWRSDSGALRYVTGAGEQSEHRIRKEMFGDE